jgi:hypothetical protein
MTMIPSSRQFLFLAGLVGSIHLAPVHVGQSVEATSSLGSKIWVGRYQEMEEYLRTAECVQIQAFTSKPSLDGRPALARCVLRAGGPVARMAWLSLPPGVYRGFRESYKFNIAAYELDKLLNLDMVPPAVERELQSRKGSATLWVEDVQDLTTGAPGESERKRWEQQIAMMLAFDSLIGNSDRNRSNMLRDNKWNLILIDHTRAFATSTELQPDLTRVDKELWGRIEGLTRKQLDATLGPWLEAGQIAALLERRDKMRGCCRPSQE